MNSFLKKIINKESVNPYSNVLRSSRHTLQKIHWDLSRDAFVSRSNLNFIKNRFAGEKAIIMCNGPSLLKVNFDLLLNAKVYTIGLNKINLLFDKTDFRPNAIVAVNPYVIEQNKDYYMNSSIPLYLDQKAARRFSISATKNRSLLFSSGGYPGFSGDIRYSVCQGATVTFVAMQLAYFMGFKQVALVGCDHNFATKGPDHKLVSAENEDPNHFDPKYFAGGVPWQLPSIAESEVSYIRAKRFFEYDNRMIYNCTVGGKLEVFPRLTLERFLSL